MGAKKKVALPEVKVGQVWIDADWRQDGNRSVRVLERVKGSDRKDPAWLCQVFIGDKDTGRTTKIRQSRFKPGSTGYRLKMYEYINQSVVPVEPVEVKVPVEVLGPVEGFPSEPTADVVTEPSSAG